MMYDHTLRRRSLAGHVGYGFQHFLRFWHPHRITGSARHRFLKDSSRHGRARMSAGPGRLRQEDR